MLERFIYVSRANSDLGPGAVAGLVRAAAARNAVEGLSGSLVWHDGWFVQALEGPPAALDAAWSRIRRDPRHSAVSFRSRERALCRLFAGQGQGWGPASRPQAGARVPGLVLQTGPALDPSLLREFDYAAGFPAGDFPADVLLEFMVRACRGGPAAQRADRGAAAGR
jgi:hypothetical protein